MTLQEPKRDPENAERLSLQPYLPGPQDHILDIGCGNGRLTWLLARTAACAAGIDVDLEELRRAPDAHPEGISAKVCFAAAASEAMPFASESFDLALFTWSF
jgi:ubiquinone/menaquinone biosynthesis C-methylase UbiE